MFTEERQSAIERCLRENGKVRVKELSEKFQVTEDCIRKDLKILENAGKLKRTYGGAILSQDYPLERDVVDRRNYHLDKKKTIASKAFKLIKNNETIFLDISTTNIELAKLLAASDMRVVVVSNMIDILQILASSKSITYKAASHDGGCGAQRKRRTRGRSVEQRGQRIGLEHHEGCISYRFARARHGVGHWRPAEGPHRGNLWSRIVR